MLAYVMHLAFQSALLTVFGLACYVAVGLIANCLKAFEDIIDDLRGKL